MLHDSIGQSLAFSKREIGVLQKQSPESVRKGLEYVKEQIELAIRQTRDLTFELSPTTLHTFGLEAAVEELVEQFAAREQPAVPLRGDRGRQAAHRADSARCCTAPPASCF